MTHPTKDASPAVVDAAGGLIHGEDALAAAEGRAAPMAAPGRPLTLAELDAQFATEDAVPFEPPMPNGDPSGVILYIRSEQAPSVEQGIARLVNERRKAMQLLEARAASSRPGEVVSKIEEETLHVRKLTALRIAGWDTSTIADEPTEENKLRLLRRIPSWGEPIITKGRELATFTPASPKS